jgi:pectin methylesterase-like acyl-CoA thioesterase
MATATVLALGVFGVSAASAATLTVCPCGPPECGFSHIQAAVNAASSGDTIEIAAGTYNLSFPELNIEKNLTLQGAGAQNAPSSADKKSESDT